MSEMVMPRRSALGLLGGLATAVSAPRGAMAATGSIAGYDTPDGKLRALIMMRGALDDRLVIYWLRSQYFGLVDGAITPMLGMVSASFSRYRPHKDGGYVAARGEAAYFTDFQGSDVQASVRNPYTGQMMQTPERSPHPSPVRIQADSTISVAEGAGLQFKNVVEDVEIVGGDVLLNERSMSTLPIAGSKPSLYNEIVTYRATAADMADPAVKRPACTTSVTTTISWRSWMGMGDRPGHILAVGAGGFVSSIDQLPPSWIRATSRLHPDMLKDPVAYLAPVWNSMG